MRRFRKGGNTVLTQMMRFFSTQQCPLTRCGPFAGAVDWHCHLLPGVDDGVQTMEEALALLRQYEALGFREIWLTPHIMEDLPNTGQGLRQVFTALQEAARAQGTSLQLHLAAEYMLDALFVERLAAGDLLPLGHRGRHLLVETRCGEPPIHVDSLLRMMRDRSFVPVLAHPERYIYMGPEDYASLKKRGVDFQLNLGSLVGAYGPEVRRRARRLWTAGAYNLWGTDLHSPEDWRRMAKAGRKGRNVGKAFLNYITDESTTHPKN